MIFFAIDFSDLDFFALECCNSIRSLIVQLFALALHQGALIKKKQ